MRFISRSAILLAAACLAIAADAAARASEPVRATGTLQAAFAPDEDVEGIIADVIAEARQQVLVQAYLLTSKPITAALIAAHRRQVEVLVLVDADQLDKTDTSTAPRLAAAGIPVWLETRYQNAHNKVIVTDPASPDATVITGSFNYTWTAQHKNAENILVARKNQALAAQYAANWTRHRREAQPFQPGASRSRVQ
ncbi:phospholipase D family nuclease [Noviherbaspirillum galbum]|uniref:phospholipase D n=1 Tax=Noviherbaspirillum galbum TaxID=2709383 RepID=A0A6B3SHV8_9BURK|nr:phospholipase D family protein [Noviherbaspirillum galbum]NEX60437.1 phospholipase D family protein [Noviherbaspirillum galbum]